MSRRCFLGVAQGLEETRIEWAVNWLIVFFFQLVRADLELHFLTPRPCPQLLALQMAEAAHSRSSFQLLDLHLVAGLALLGVLITVLSFGCFLVPCHLANYHRTGQVLPPSVYPEMLP